MSFPNRGAQLLSIAMANRGWGVNHAGRELGSKPGYISRWVRGLGVPGLRWALKLERVLGIPPEAWSDHAAPAESGPTLHESATGTHD